MPSLKSEIELINMYGKEVLAVTLNTSDMNEKEKKETKINLEKELKIPIILPLDEGVDELLPLLINLKKKHDN